MFTCVFVASLKTWQFFLCELFWETIKIKPQIEIGQMNATQTKTKSKQKQKQRNRK